jgi:hypothetical protein
MNDGINGLLPKSDMDPDALVKRNVYSITPDQPLLQREFGWYCKEAWAKQGLAEDSDYRKEFSFSDIKSVSLGGLGWCEAPFVPDFETKVLEDRGDHELIQDHAGRQLLCFKGRRTGFMPEYLDHPVKDQKTWEEHCSWRMNPSSKERYTGIEEKMIDKVSMAKEGAMVTQGLIGGIMYLRSLIGPEGWLYMFYDEPDCIHSCMQAWLKVADAVIAKHQEYLTIDEIFFAEDGCYKSGSLISREMMEEFIFPYYQQLISNLKSRQLDQNRHLYVQIDTDGFSVPVIDWYREAIDMDVMSPFEVAAGCDVVEVGQKYPWLIISGGVDKRILASSKVEIDKMVDSIMPIMKKRGGYIPTCDHGVPAEVSLENYRHYRNRMLEFA